LNLSLAAPASGYVRHPCGFIEPCLRSSGWILSTPPALMVRVILSHKAGRSHDISDTTEVRTNYQPQSVAATGGMLANATGMAAASSFGRMFIGTITRTRNPLIPLERQTNCFSTPANLRDGSLQLVSNHFWRHGVFNQLPQEIILSLVPARARLVVLQASHQVAIRLILTE